MIKTLYPIFQHWSKKGSVYIISDTHFDDKDREFMGYNISEQDQIYILKKYCHKNDTLIHLGDVGNPEYLNQLKCYKVLIMGNHDQSIEKFKPYFNEIYSGPLIIAEKIILSHELLDINWAWNIHGHNHNEDSQDKYHTNMASNVVDYKPLNLGKAIKTGVLLQISSIHRQTIDEATKRRAGG